MHVRSGLRAAVVAAAVLAGSGLDGGALGGQKRAEGAATFALTRVGLQPPRIDAATSPLHHPGFDVFAATGGVYHLRDLFDLPGGRERLPVSLRRLSDLDVSYDGPYGRNWWLSLHSFLRAGQGGSVTLFDTDGREDVFTPAGDGYLTPPGLAAALEPLRKGSKVKGWTLRHPDGSERFYDSKGRWKTWTRPDGQVVKFASGSDLRLKKVQTPEKRTLSFKYGKDRRLASIRLFDKRVFAFTYDARGNLTAVARPLRTGDDTPARWGYAYDAQDRLTEVRNSAGGVVGTVAYDGDDRVASITDFAGKAATFAWDDRLVTGTDRDGTIWEVRSDGNGQVTERTVRGLPSGEETDRYEHDALLRRTVHERPAGDVMEWAFAPGDDPLERGSVTTFTHRSADAPSAAPAEVVTTRTFVPGTGLVLSETRPGGGRHDFAYDGALLVSVRGPAVLTAAGATRPETRYEYDAFGRRTAVVHPGGSRDEFVYAKKPRDLVVEAVRDAGPGGANERTRYRYDASGRLAGTLYADDGSRLQSSDPWDRVVSVTDGNGVETRMEYDRAGNLVRMTTPLRDADGGVVGTGEQVFETSFDALGRVLAERRGDGFGGLSETAYAYASGLDRPTRVTYPGGATADVEYDARRRRIAVTTSDGESPDHEEAFTYDAHGNVRTRSDGAGGVTTYVYDGLGRLESVTDAEDRSTVYGRDADGRVLSETVMDGEGTEFSRTRYAYDAAGNQVRTERDRFVPGDADPGVTETWTKVHTLRGLPALETDACGATVAYAYDGLGRVVSIDEETLGRVRAFEYDERGRLLLRRETRGAVERVTRVAYDACGEVRSVDTPEGIVAFRRDSLGHAVEVTDPLGRTRVSVVDAAHRRLSTQEADPAGGAPLRREWRWDGEDRLVGFTGADLGERTYLRDGLGRMVGEQRGGQTVVSFGYDLAGRVSSRTDAAGTVVSMAYDLIGRVVGRQASTGAAQSLVWNGNHQLLSGTDTPATGSPVSITRAWDSLRNRLVDSQPGGEVERTYGDAGGVATLTTPEGWTYEYARDGAGRVTAVERDGVDYLTYQYVAGTRIPSRRASDDVESLFTVDGRGRLVRAAHATPSAPSLASSFDATYDAMGRRLTHERQDGKGERFEFDTAGRLVRHFMESTDPQSGSPSGFRLRTDFAWAPGLGRPASTTRADAPEAGLAAASTTQTFSYDGSGRMTSGHGSALPYDAAGRAASMPEDRPAYDAGARNLTWDAFGRLLEVRRASNGTLLGAFSYDVLDRPVSAREEQFTGIGILTRLRVFDGCRLVSERSPLLNNPSDGWDLFYVPDPAGRGHVASGFNDVFDAEYLWETDCRGMPGHLFIRGGTAFNESYRLWTPLGLPHFETGGGAPFRGAPSLNTLTNPPGLASSHATGITFSWSQPLRDPFLPRPLDPTPWGREGRLPFPGPPGPLPGPGGGGVGDEGEPDWEEVVAPEDLVEDRRCEDALAELEGLLEGLGAAKDRARECGEDLDRIGRLREKHLGKIDLINQALGEILEAQNDLNKWLDRIRTADLVLNSADAVVGAAKGALDIKGSLKNLGKMGGATGKLFGGASGKAADKAMGDFGEALAEEVGGLVSGELEGAVADRATEFLEGAGVIDGAGFSTVGAIDALSGLTGNRTTGDILAALAANFDTGLANRRALEDSLDRLDRLERDRLGFKEYIREGTANLCASANQALDDLAEGWGEATAGPYRERLAAVKAAIAAATTR